MPSPSKVLYLGRISRTPHRSDAYRYATIDLLAESDASGLRWLGPVRDVKSRFPTRGRVHWHDAPFDLQLGSVWQFSIDEHPTAEHGDRSEHFQLEGWPIEPTEVLDLRDWNDELALRSAITSDGITLSHPPLVPRTLLWLASGVYVGPLPLKQVTGTELWVHDDSAGNRSSDRVSVWKLADQNVNKLALDGDRWFVSPRYEFGKNAGLQNWMSDKQVARSILTRLRKMDPERVKAIDATDKVFREYLDHVDTGRIGSTDLALERARGDRLRGIRDAIQRDAALLKEAGEALLDTESVRAELEHQVELTVRESLLERQADLDAALSVSSQKLARLMTEVAAKQAESDDVASVLATKREELNAFVAACDNEIEEKLAELARRPEVAFADSAIMRALLRPVSERVTNMYARQANDATALVNSGLETSSAKINQLHSDEAVRGALAAHALAAGLSIHSMLGVHASFIAGIVPVVTGSRGYDLLHAYASAVAGGRLHWVPVGASAIEPQDILGQYNSVLGRIIPSASGLLDVINEAITSERLHLVVLDGFNRAPTEAYLAPILQAAAAARNNDSRRLIPIATPSVVSEDDPYRSLARLAWPSNVLIACIPIHGSATLPVPSSVWRFLSLFDADDRDRPLITCQQLRESATSCGEIPSSQWKSSVASARLPVANAFGGVSTIARAMAAPSGEDADAIRIATVLVLNGLPESDAIALAANATLVARWTSGAKMIEESIRSASVSLTGWQTIMSEALQLRN